MKYLISVLILLISLVYFNSEIKFLLERPSEAKAEVVESWLSKQKGYIKIHEEIDDFPQEVLTEKEIYKKQTIKEVVLLWTMFLDHGGASPDDSRRDKLEDYAEHLVDAVTVYQNTETDIGGRLPKGKNSHLIVAQSISQESSIRPGVVGRKKGEVGLLQVHGIALAGVEPEVVKNNPKVGIFLGVRWLAASVDSCFPRGFDDDKWTDDNWIRVLSVYQAGEKRAIGKNGRCKRLGVSRKRVRKMNMYRTWIDIELGG